MAPRGAKKRSQTGGGKGNATFPPLQQSATKAWAGVADSEFDLRVICKGKYFRIVDEFVANQTSGGELLLCHRAVLSSASSSLSSLLHGHKVRMIG